MKNSYHYVVNCKEKTVLLSPDAGASKKTGLVAKHCGYDSIVYGSKIRDTKTGEIVKTTVLVEHNIGDKDVLIVDDICDGGRTFIELAKVLRQKGAESVDLYVTHGIFSAGLDPLMLHIDHIFTTESVCSLKSNEYLTVIK